MYYYWRQRKNWINITSKLFLGLYEIYFLSPKNESTGISKVKARLSVNGSLADVEGYFKLP